MLLPCRPPSAGRLQQAHSTHCVHAALQGTLAGSALLSHHPASASFANPLRAFHLTSQLVLCRPPKAGDVIIFHPAKGAIPEERPWFQEAPVFIKRVVAVGGDQLEVNARASACVL